MHGRAMSSAVARDSLGRASANDRRRANAATASRVAAARVVEGMRPVSTGGFSNSYPFFEFGAPHITDPTTPPLPIPIESSNIGLELFVLGGAFVMTDWTPGVRHRRSHGLCGQGGQGGQGGLGRPQRPGRLGQSKWPGR